MSQEINTSDFTPEIHAQISSLDTGEQEIHPTIKGLSDQVKKFLEDAFPKSILSFPEEGINTYFSSDHAAVSFEFMLKNYRFTFGVYLGNCIPGQKFSVGEEGEYILGLKGNIKIEDKNISPEVEKFFPEGDINLSSVDVFIYICGFGKNIKDALEENLSEEEAADIILNLDKNL